MNTKILNVPYFSQLDQGAEYYTNDCLAACFRMVWGYTQIQKYGKDNLSVTVNNFGNAIYKSRKSLGGITDIYKLPVNKALPYKPVSKSSGITLDRIKSSIDLEWPVIALVLYSHIRQISPIGHFITIVGYDDTCFVYHDPYYTGNDGKNRYTPADNLNNALNPEQNKYFSNPYQGLIYRGVK